MQDNKIMGDNKNIQATIIHLDAPNFDPAYAARRTSCKKILPFITDRSHYSGQYMLSKHSSPLE